MTTRTRIGCTSMLLVAMASGGGCRETPDGWNAAQGPGLGDAGRPGVSADDAGDVGAPGAGGGGDGAGGAGWGLPCDVDTVLATSCRSCHGTPTAYGAPEPLVTYADLVAPAKTDPSRKVYEVMESLIHSTANPMPPPPATPLSAASLSTLDAWVSAGAPGSTQACTPPAPDAGIDPMPLPCTADTHIRPPSPFAIDPTMSDEYVCYGFDVSTTQKRHVIGFGPHVDNKTVVHHMLLFQASQSYPSTPTPCQAFGSAAWTLVGGWAPGGQPFLVPPEAGFPEEGTTHWIMQVHYNNVNALKGQVDSSGYDLCTTEQLRPNDADVLAVGSVSFSIPPHATMDLSCNYTYGAGPIHVFAATPHMHLLGQSMKSTDVTRSTAIVDRPFNFQSQIGVPTSVDIANGDVLNTHCVWDNSTDQAVPFGENTGSEMCFGFLQYYPKITSPLWSWTFPSDFASCTSTIE